jgi:methyl-accepting chemotaxis protein WspA
MKQRLRINQLVPLGFGVVVVVTLVTSLISKLTTDTLVESLASVSRTNQIQSDIQHLETVVLAAENANRAYLITGRDEYLGPANSADGEVKKVIAELERLIIDSQQQKRLFAIQPVIQERLTILANIRQLKRASKEEEMRNLFLSSRNKENVDDFKQKLQEMIDAEEELLAKRQQITNQSQTFFNYITLGSIILIVTIAILVSIVIANVLRQALGEAVKAAEQVSSGDLTTRLEANADDDMGRLFTALKNMVQNLNSLIRQVQHSGIQVTTSSTQIAASGKQLEATMTEQVASTNEVVATTREIAATTSELVKTMAMVVEMLEISNKAADGGRKDLVRMETTMRQLAAATDSISTKLGVISEKANNINGVVATITKVADQTNLLSLNAAIEAEKAGEYGLGFAVVAREIRRLADQTAIATLDIEQMVKEMQGAVSTGVMEMDKFSREVEQGVEDIQKASHQLTVIIEQVQALSPQFVFVNQGMEAQSQGTQQISEAMRQLSESSAQTASSLRETNSAIEQLNDAAQNLRREVAGFKVQES